MPRDGLYLVEIVQACDHVAAFLADVDLPQWLASELVRSAVLQKLIVVGEAAGGLTEQLRSTHPEVPWAAVRAFRNVAVHAYFSVDWPRVWSIARDDIPPLRDQVLKVLRQAEPELASRVQGDARG